MGRSVDLLVPGIGWKTGLQMLGGSDLKPVQLEGLLGRARHRAMPAMGLTELIFQGFRVTSQPGRDLPSGAIVSLALGKHPGAEVCALATPVHLLTDRDRLLLLRHASESLPQEQAEQLAEQFNRHFSADGMRLDPLSSGQWILTLPELANITTSSLEQVTGRHIDPYLPKGPDAVSWHRLLNEIQMLFFQSEVNQRRSQEGQLPVNGLWISGIGRLPEVQTSYHKVFADSPLAKGLAQMAGIPCDPDYHSLLEGLLSDGRYLVVMSDMLDAEIDVQGEAWLEAIELTEQRLLKLVEIMDHRDDRINLYTCDGSCFVARSRAGFLDRFRPRKRLDQRLG
ncbi:MAG: hypothetical protein ABW101_04030 [Candidatus Thiodiazotropha sp.]